jgi:preprotein translocase subunit SecG
MIFGLLVTLFVILCFMLIGLILIQKGKGSMGIGTLGGGAQMLFGGSGGQDLFQKITWILGALFMAGSLILAIMKTKQYETSRYLTTPSSQQMPVQNPQP